jgi:alpha-aminoadipic semialdehyde synthase
MGSKGAESVRVGIRREDKSIWERRVPITPSDARDLAADNGLEILVQPSAVRVFTDDEYEQSGVSLQDDLSACPVVFGVKEMPLPTFQPGHTYVFFAHVIKGQLYNMEMLRRLMDLGCNLIDYEKVTDEHGRRLIFFGRHAGLAGMIDTLWALGRRLDWEGISNPFSTLQQTHAYASLAEAKKAVSAVGAQIADHGLPSAITPFICGFAGYGNVFRGANEIYELLPVEEVAPQEVRAVAAGSDAADLVYKVVFKEEHTVLPIESGRVFKLQDYYDHPERYQSQFGSYLPHLSVLVNCVYWEERYPRLVTKADVQALYSAGQPRLRVIGDISCDIEGAIECTVRSTEPGDPVYVYDPGTDAAVNGVAGEGPVIMAVDILPSELPRESSIYFSGVLRDHMPAIARADYSAPFDDLDLPPEIKRALIVHQGELTPAYRYLRKYVGG